MNNNKTILQQRDKGTRIFGKDIGGLSGLNYVSDMLKENSVYFVYLSEFLKKNGGYIAGKSLRGFTYDWRLGVKEWSTSNLEIGSDFYKLKKLIEETFYLNNEKRIALLGHSMRGPFLQYFLANFVNQQWKDKFVKNFIPVSAAFDGSLFSMMSLLISTNYGIPIINPKSMTPIMGIFGSLSYMTPRLNEIPFLKLKGKVFDRNNYKEYLNDIKMLESWKVYQHEFIESEIKFKAPNVTTYCIYSYGVPTINQFSYNGTKDNSDLVVEDFKVTVSILL